MMCESLATVECVDGSSTFNLSRTTSVNFESSDECNESAPVKLSTRPMDWTTHLTPKKKYRHLVCASPGRPTLLAPQFGAKKSREPLKIKEGKIYKPLQGRIRHPKSKQEDFHRICLVCSLPAEYYNSGAISCESCKMFFRRNHEKLHVLQCVASRNGKTSMEDVEDDTHANGVQHEDWLADIKCDTRQTGKKRLCALCRLKKCFQVGMRPINHGGLKGNLGSDRGSVNPSTGSEDSNFPPGVFACQPPATVVKDESPNVIPKKVYFESERSMPTVRLLGQASMKPPGRWPVEMSKKFDPLFAEIIKGALQQKLSQTQAPKLSVAWRADTQQSDSEEEEEEDLRTSVCPVSIEKLKETAKPLDTTSNPIWSQHNSRSAFLPFVTRTNSSQVQLESSLTSQQIHPNNSFPQLPTLLTCSTSAVSGVVNGFQLATSLFSLSESDPFLRILLNVPQDAPLPSSFCTNFCSELAQPLQILFNSQFTVPQPSRELVIWDCMRHFAEDLSVKTLLFCQHMPPLPQWSAEERKSVLKTRLTLMVCYLSVLFSDEQRVKCSWNAALAQYKHDATFLQEYHLGISPAQSVLPALSLFITRINEVLHNDLQMRLTFLALKLLEVLPSHRRHLASEQLFNNCVQMFHRYSLQLWRAFAASATSQQHAQLGWQNFCQLYAWSQHHFDVGCTREVAQLHARPEMVDLTRSLVAAVDRFVK